MKQLDEVKRLLTALEMRVLIALQCLSLVVSAVFFVVSGINIKLGISVGMLGLLTAAYARFGLWTLALSCSKMLALRGAALVVLLVLWDIEVRVVLR